tara:strand:+ start:23501 stop:23662 length:162 start_codon:yes stop_codon:yes gene_type:complete
MPFKSKKQERYLQINEPEIYQDWVEKYGRFSAESLCIVCNENLLINLTLTQWV